MRVFLSAGEASGDAYAAAFVSELRKLEPNCKFEGVGGKRLAASIGDLIADSSNWGAIGIFQSLKVVGRALAGAQKVRKRLGRGDPGLFVPIDFGFFNIAMCRYAKKLGWKILYFVPPSSWRRDKQGKDLPSLTDAVVTPFPWSAEILKSMGANAYFFGHPLKHLIKDSRVPTSLVRERIAVLPGSRSHELENNLPMIAATVAGEVGRWEGGFENSIPQTISGQATGPLTHTLEFAVAPNLDVSAVETFWNRLAPGRNDVFTKGDVYGVLSRAQAAIVCSGTATLEAALIGCPLVVVYRVSRATYREAKLIGFKMPKFISLPNIVLDRHVVTELAGMEIATSAIRVHLDSLLEDGPARDEQLRAFKEIEHLLGAEDALTKTAELAVSLMKGA